MRAIPQAVRDAFARGEFTGSNRPRTRIWVYRDEGTAVELIGASASISRGNAEFAQTAEITIPNVDPNDSTRVGYYSPDRSEDKDKDLYKVNGFEGFLMPGRKVEIYAGYGINITRQFIGEIDDIIIGSSENDYSLRLSCRDLAAVLLLRNVTNEAGQFAKVYAGAWWVHDIVEDALIQAGITDYRITVSDVGVEDKLFERCKWADIVAWCQSVTAYTFRFDEDGTAIFAPPDDRQPESIDDVVLHFGEPGQLTNHPIVVGSEIVTSQTPDEVTGEYTLYTAGIDYAVDYDQGIIRALSGGALDGDTVPCRVRYVYSAWEFDETQLIDCQYTTSRRDLHAQIRFTGAEIKDANGNGTGEHYTATYHYQHAATYGVKADDVDFVDHSELASDEDCVRAANAAGRLMSKKARVVRFTIPMHPSLQIGDVIRVIEANSTARALYHITQIDLALDPDWCGMTITACIADMF